tara:strand:+ start:2766 stop:3122 length:357 start_codon:yes stop_codon:yes gene_type:complete
MRTYKDAAVRQGGAKHDTQQADQSSRPLNPYIARQLPWPVQSLLHRFDLDFIFLAAHKSSASKKAMNRPSLFSIPILRQRAAPLFPCSSINKNLLSPSISFLIIETELSEEASSIMKP